MRRLLEIIFWFLPALLIYAYLCHQFNFTQDDAYISYRYVANFLDGHGLVYNIGERVEGYTNFGWVIYLIFWGVLGVSYIAVSKVTGFILGFGIIVLTYFISRHVFSEKDELFRWLAVYLVSLNQSLAYWSPAGLETAAFAFFAMLSLLLYFRRSRLLVFAITLSVLIRPEGGLVALILLMIEAVETRRWPEFTGPSILLAFVFCLPLLIFKVVYYGSIFPNPFYAKTAFSVENLTDGLEYTWRFLTHYGLWGLTIVVPLLAWPKLPQAFRTIWLLTVIYTVYVVVVGGDVLMVHRFFVPVLVPVSILTVSLIWLLTQRFNGLSRRVIGLAVMSGVFVLSIVMPRHHVLEYNDLERRFTAKMSYYAEQLSLTDQSDFSVALPTIGVLGYKLQGHRIIDLLGLTDSTIARHSEPAASTMVSTWKERRHNSAYVLGLEPDYILFSTGVKPSAPAEMALLLYRQFHDCYRTIGWSGGTEIAGPKILHLIFKRVRPVKEKPVPVYPVEFVDYYRKGLETSASGDYPGAVRWYERAIEVSPDPPYIYLLYDLAASYVFLEQYDQAFRLMDSIVARDSLIFMAHAMLYKDAVFRKDQQKAAAHQRWIQMTVPWLWKTLEAETEALIENTTTGGR